MNEQVRATVEKIVRDGPHGPYAVATCENVKGSITFSLEPSVWHEPSWPEEGTEVILDDVQKKRQGWRAKSGRYVRPSDEHPATSKQEIPMSQLATILNPLESYTTAYFMLDDKICPDKNGHRRERMSHAEFVRRQVLPLLTDARAKFGDEVVARELVEISVPVYSRLPVDEVISFWSVTVRGLEDGTPEEHDEFARKNAGKLNADLAAKIGVKRLFAPILDLAVVHGETKVFGINKFFVTHATRMGHVVTMFTYEDYLAYIELAKKLLRGKVFDWSIESDEEQWTKLAPIIRRFGLRPVVEPMVDAMVALSDIPGTKDEKYHFSYFSKTFDDLTPLLVALVLADESTDVIGKTLNLIVKAVQALHTLGAFRTAPYSWDSQEAKFFSCFGKKVRRIMEVGMEQMLKELTQLWTPRLIADKTDNDE